MFFKKINITSVKSNFDIKFVLHLEFVFYWEIYLILLLDSQLAKILSSSSSIKFKLFFDINY